MRGFLHVHTLHFFDEPSLDRATLRRLGIRLGVLYTLPSLGAEEVDWCSVDKVRIKLSCSESTHYLISYEYADLYSEYALSLISSVIILNGEGLQVDVDVTSMETKMRKNTFLSYQRKQWLVWYLYLDCLGDLVITCQTVSIVWSLQHFNALIIHLWSGPVWVIAHWKLFKFH